MIEAAVNTFGINIIPDNDEQRLEALRRYQILDTPPEEAFTNLAHLIANYFDTPIALISLVDKNRVQFKGNVGMPGVKNVERGVSLCSLAVLSSEPTIIDNPIEDPCLLANPLVHGKFGLRFYAGAPITTPDGFNIGTVCIVDKKERTFRQKDKDQLVRFAKVVMHDIELRLAAQKQREAEEELSRVQAQLYAALKVGKVTPWHWNIPMNKVIGGPELADMFGVDFREAADGLPVEVFANSIHPEDQAHVWDRIHTSIRTGQDYMAEFRIVTQDHEIRWAIGRARVEYSEQNEPIGLTGITIDLTENKKAEQQIRIKNEELITLTQELQFVTDTMPQLVWATEPDGYAYFFNKGWLEYTGADFEKLKGYGWSELLHPEDVEKTHKAWQVALESGGTYDVEYRLKRWDGQYRWFVARGIPMRDNSGVIQKWYGTSTDITDRKEAAEVLEQRVKERTQELELKNRELEQFTYVSHHDLQEPLRKILLFSDLVKIEAAEKLSDTALVRLNKVTDAARRMSNALRDVLDFASLNKEEHFSPTDLNEVLGSAKVDLEIVIQEKKATIQQATLPTIRAVPQQMHQLFYNLLNNALKFTKEDVAPVIKVSCSQLGTSDLQAHPELHQEKSYYKLCVQDNGIGFNPGAAEKIFGMFQRLHNKDAYAGTGIGLALVKKVVLNHGGKIWAEGNPGEGATFWVLLPED